MLRKYAVFLYTETSIFPRGFFTLCRIEQLRAALWALGLKENRDFWLVDNGTSWRLRWFDHTTPEQHVQGDELVNAILNS